MRRRIALSRSIREIARTPRFREAVTWQNPAALDTAVEPLLRHEPETTALRSRYRRLEELVASYWQRYCVKNDSIGFFGPIGWGELSPDKPTSLEPGEHLLGSCDVYFEAWAIDTLAGVIGREQGMRQFLCPRRVPFVALKDRQVVVANGRDVVDLSHLEAAVLEKCQGVMPAHELASRVLKEETGEGVDVDGVYAVLESFRRRRWIEWKIEIPITVRPERHLRNVLERVPDDDVRQAALAKLEPLEAALADLAQAEQDATRLRSRLDALNETFVDLTGAAATRRHGATYGARTLVYKDCRRDIQLVLGNELREALAPIDVCLHSARWLTFQTGALVRDALNDIHDRLTAAGGSVTVSRMWFETMTFLQRDGSRIVDEVQAEFHRRWRAVLPGDGAGRHERHYGLDEVWPRVREEFDAPHAGWHAARYLCPDLMIRAREVEAIRCGDFEVVLGELHLGINTLRSACFVAQHPDPDRLFRALDADFPGPLVRMVLPKEASPRLTTRTQPLLIRDKDFLVAVFHQTTDPGRARVVRGAEVVVERDVSHLVAMIEGHEFDLLDVFSEMMTNLVFDRFQIFSDDVPYVPRVSVDRLIVARRTWNVDPRVMTFACEDDQARRFVLARRWLADMDMPPRMFVKSPLEVKPFFCDFESPIYVSILCKTVRRLLSDDAGAKLALSEMLPDLEHTWLTDRSGNRYTAELRMAAFDLRDVA